MPSDAAETVESVMRNKKEYNIHRCRFIDYLPPKITALAFSHSSLPNEAIPENLLLAIGRSNGDIDLWSPLHDWVHKCTLRGGKGRSIEGLAWIPPPAYRRNAPPRLFSIGSSTYLTEWYITTGLPKQHLPSNAGPIWSLTASPDASTLALGCEDGTVLLVDVADGSFTHSRTLERQSSQVLTLAWHPNGNILVGGCSDSTIRVWDIANPYGRIIAQMQVERSGGSGNKKTKRRKLDTLVWSVKVTSDGTVISGDSTGSIKIWESQFWSLKQSFKVHKADVLCLALDDNEQVIYSSGVDRKTMQFRRLGNGKWTHVDGKTFHKHDVRAMTSFESKGYRLIVSGGVDRSFSVLSFVDSVENLRAVPPVPQESVVSLAVEARLLLSWHGNQVKIWRIKEIDEAEADGEDQIGKRYLLNMELNDEENISTAAISPDGLYLLVATSNHSKLFALTVDAATSNLAVELLGVFPHGARLAKFTPTGDTIVLVTPDSEVQIHPFLDADAPTTRFPYEDEGSYINKLAISPDGKSFATSSSNSVVLIQSFNSEILPQMLPQPSSAITSLNFLTPDLISMTLADRNRLLLFELRGNDWTIHPWCHKPENMPSQIGITVDKCIGTFICDNDPSRIWLWGANWLSWIEPNGEKSVKSESESTEEYPNWITYRYREVLLADYLSSTKDKTELVVVERPRHEIMEDVVEPRFYRHEYGT